MQIGALGDIHGAFETVHIIMRRHADVLLWVCVGDVASNDGEYFTPEAPLHFIKGNNEDFDVLAAAVRGRPIAPNLYYLQNGGPHRVGPWRVAALGGTFAPSWYNTPAAARLDAALPAQRRPARCRSVARGGAWRHLRSELVPLACVGAAALERPAVVGNIAQARQEPRRQTPAFRPR